MIGLVEHCESVDVRVLARRPWRYGNITIGQTRESITIAAPHLAPLIVQLDRTPQHFGGMRSWFRCPSCARRCAIVMRPPWSSRYACRHCCGVRYLSETSSRKERALLRVHRLRAALGASPDLDRPVPDRPPRGMIPSRFERLVAALAKAEARLGPAS